MDNTLIRALRYLHSSAQESQNNLRLLLEESLMIKYGQGNEIGPLFNVSQKMDFSVTTINANNQIEHIHLKDDSKNATSDNELELDLLKEDLMCIVCNGMGVGARNRLVECCDCHNLYHQECHHPSITEEEIETNATWICITCKETGTSHKKAGLSPSTIAKASTTANSSSTSSRKFLEQEVSDVNPSTSFSSAKSSASSSKLSASTSSLSSRLLTPNINIISADKRLQIMKKKAAKMQEKRKLSRP